MSLQKTTFMFLKKFGQKSSFLKTTFMSDLKKKNCLKIVLTKDDFHDLKK